MTQTLQERPVPPFRGASVSPASSASRTRAAETRAPQSSNKRAPSAAIFAITLLLSSMLLFLIQPMFAKLFPAQWDPKLGIHVT